MTAVSPIVYLRRVTESCAQGRKPASYWINKPQANLPRRASECKINYSHHIFVSSEESCTHFDGEFVLIGCAWGGMVTVPGWGLFAPFRKEARREGPIMNREVGNSLMPGNLARYEYVLLWEAKGKGQVTIHP